MNRARAVQSLLLVVLCAPVTAAPQDPAEDVPAWCDSGGDFEWATLPRLKLAEVIGPPGARVHFLKDDGDCPKAGTASCRTGLHVVPGQRVILSRTFQDWSCGWHRTRGLTNDPESGWLPAASLRIFAPDTTPPLEAWVATWRRYNNVLRVRSLPSRGQRGVLLVDGEAFWYGGGDIVHFGNVGGWSKPLGNELIVYEGDCRIRLKLLGDFVVAYDNRYCGGANVRFNGVYYRQHSGRRRR